MALLAVLNDWMSGNVPWWVLVLLALVLAGLIVLLFVIRKKQAGGD
jgi:membrane protein YdbS with pleckstrin-like domain